MEDEVKVSELTEATQVNNSDLLMIIQNGLNKKITKQNFEASESKKVKKIEKISTQGSTDIYRVTYTDNSTETYQFNNGEVTQVELDEVIEELDSVKSENAYLNSVIEQAFDEVSGTGENITLENTIQAKFKKSPLPMGNTYQATRSGKNLLNLNNTTGEKTQYGLTASMESSVVSINGNGTGADGANTGMNQAFTLTTPITLDAGTYTYSATLIGGSFSCASSSRIRKIHLNGVNKEISTQNGSTSFNKNTFTITETTQISGIQIIVYGDCRFDNAKIGLQLEEGSTATDYEEYGASPSPEFPSEIETVTGDVNVTVVRNQLWKPYNYSRNASGIDWIVSEDGTIQANGTATGNSYSSTTVATSDFLFKLPAGQYTLSGGTSDIELQVINSDTSIATTSSSGKVSFNLEEVTEIQLRARCQEGITVSNVTIKPMLNSGDTEKEWEPYQSQELWLDLGGKNLYSGHTKGIGLNNTTGAEITSANSATTDYIPVDFAKNPKYTISGMPNTLSNYVAAYNSSKQFLGRTGAGNSAKRTMSASSFTSGTAQGTGDIAYLRSTVYKGTNDSGTIDDIDSAQIQLEKGSTKTRYSPYIENPIELCKIGDYQDYIYKSGDNWYVHKEIGKQTINVTASAFSTASINGVANTKYVTNSIPGAKTQSGQHSNKFYSSRNSYIGDKTTFEGYPMYTISSTSVIVTTSDDTIENLKSKVNGGIIYYQLATPTDTQITDTTLISQLNAIEKATSYKGTTHIYSTNELSPIFDVTALRPIWDSAMGGEY